MSGSFADSRAVVLIAGLVGLSIAAASPARAADDGYANVFSSVLGSVGLIKGDTPPDIEYRERAPLVLPKDEALPKPVAGGTQHTAAWPQDPDVLRRRKEADEARAPHTLSPLIGDKTKLMSRDEQMRGRAEDSEPVRPNGCGNDGNQRGCLVVSPDELKAEGERFEAANPDKSDTLVAGQEPERVYLTQPPKGYMKPVKTVKATAEAPEQRIDNGSARYMQQMEAKKKAEEQ